MPLLTGLVDRITYRSEDTLYTVMRVTPAGQREVVTVTGSFTAVEVGEELELEGDWVNHPTYGAQFKAVRYRALPPTTVAGVERYLASGLIKGVGPATARKIVAQFGPEALSVIETTPHRLSEVEGIGVRTADRISEAVAARRDIERVMVFLQGHGVSAGLAVKIFKYYGAGTLDVVSSNPYRLSTDVWGIGFITADRIATSMGLSPESPERIGAGLLHVLSRVASEGHAMVPEGVLLAETARILKCDEGLVGPVLERMLETRGLIREEKLKWDDANGRPVYLPSLFQCERGIARRLVDLMGETRTLIDFSFQDDLAGIETSGGYCLSAEQKGAAMKVLQCSVVVITGGPGTGKTTTLNAIIRLLEERALDLVLTAPTGRAAKRMAEATGRPAKTIHRLLEFSPSAGEGGGAFTRNGDNPLAVDAIVVDEASMIDEPLMYSLLKAVPIGARLIVVGDVDQLPSVGPGNVLKDIIDSGCVETVRLTEVFRQAADSLIVSNAHRINRGEQPVLNLKDGDFYFIDEEAPQDVAARIVEVVAQRLPKRYGLDPLSDIQVLSPMRLHEAGVENLNKLLQEALNPARPGRTEVPYRAAVLRVGDRVMQIINNYDKDAFNGDIGKVSSMDQVAKELVVTYPDASGDKDVSYDYSELDELVLSYAISIHKSQGSEYPAVVIPLTTQHYRMLRRNLIYTAVTRAKRLVVLVGTKRALSIAIGNDGAEARYTLLAPRIREAVDSR